MKRLWGGKQRLEWEELLKLHNEFGFYSECDGNPLEGLEQRKDIRCLHFEKITLVLFGEEREQWWKLREEGGS